jgi:molecular chaperone DnaK (HSP70)
MEETRMVFGIDLGTTYSCVAQVDEFDRPTVQKNFDGNNTTPSVVYFEQKDKVLVGDVAKEMMKTEPEKTVAFVKREISKDEAYDNPGKFPFGSDPTIISSHILKKIVKDANDASQNPIPVNKVVITCPAYFGTKERMRTKQAGEIAGLEVLAVINEPTAAAIAYGMKLDENKTVLVYDLGGGTFDVTVIRVSDKTITVMATDGNHQLGGYDWDKMLADYVLAKFNQEHGTNYTMDSNATLRNTLMLEAENKKKQLSQRESVNFIIDFEGKSLKVPISRVDFNQLTEVLLDETIEKTTEVIDKAKGKGAAKIDEILLVGGSSRMPQVKERVDAEFHCDSKLTDPDECVAKGAAIFALNESFSAAMDEYNDGERDEKPKNIGQKSQVRVVNVTSKSYGLRCQNSEGETIISQLIFANTSLNNCRGQQEFFTAVDNQKGVYLAVYESDLLEESIPLESANLLEEKDFQLNKEVPINTPLDAIFQVDSEGILHVFSRIENDTIEFDVKLKGVMNSEELSKAKFLASKTSVE